jgi:hypothetical protein
MSKKLKAGLVALLLALSLPAMQSPAAQRVPCGVERWGVKMLSDPAAHQVKFTPVARTTERYACVMGAQFGPGARDLEAVVEPLDDQELKILEGALGKVIIDCSFG